jgi:hypothetical protein
MSKYIVRDKDGHVIDEWESTAPEIVLAGVLVAWVFLVGGAVWWMVS